MAANPDPLQPAQKGVFGNATPPATPLSQATRMKRESTAQAATSPTVASGPAAKRQKLEPSRVRRSRSDNHEKNHEKLATPPVSKPQGCTEQVDKPARQLPSTARELATDEPEDQASEAAQEYDVVELLFWQICELRAQVRLLKRKAEDDRREIDRLRDQRNTVMAIARDQLETIDELRCEPWASRD